MAGDHFRISVILIEIIRRQHQWLWFGMRPYEANQISAFCSTSIALLLLIKSQNRSFGGRLYSYSIYGPSHGRSPAFNPTTLQAQASRMFTWFFHQFDLLDDLLPWFNFVTTARMHRFL